MLIWSCISIFIIVVASAWLWPSFAVWIAAGLLLVAGAIAAYLGYWCWRYYGSYELSSCCTKEE